MDAAPRISFMAPESLNASVPQQAPFLDPKIPLAIICDDLEAKPERSSVFL